MIRHALASALLLSLLACAAEPQTGDTTDMTSDSANPSAPGAPSSGDAKGGAASALDPEAGGATSTSAPREEGDTSEIVESNIGENAEVAPPITPADWMARTPGLGARGLHEIAMPGTHDSGTYSLISVYNRPVNDAFAPDAPGGLAKAGQFAFVTEPWSKAQGLTLGEQLAAGARFLDLRPCAELTGTLRICHGMYGPRMDDLLDDIAAFAAAHPKEIIIVNMQRFSGMQADHHAALRALITKKLGSHLLDYGAGEVSATMKLDDVWRSGKSIVVLYDDDGERAPAYMPSSEATGSYEEEWERDAKKASLEAGYGRQDPGKLFIFAGPATPDSGGRLIGFAAVPGSSHPDSLRELAKATNPVTQGWLLGEWRTRRSNIVTTDFIEDTCVFQVTQVLNGVRDVSFTGCEIGDTSWGHWAIGPYGRGVGSVTQCPIGKELVGGLCYTPCRDGYASSVFFPTVCSRGCPDGYRDDGLTCFRDAKIISSDHGSCPAYDVCGLTFAKDARSARRGTRTMAAPAAAIRTRRRSRATTAVLARSPPRARTARRRTARSATPSASRASTASVRCAGRNDRRPPPPTSEAAATERATRPPRLTYAVVSRDRGARRNAPGSGISMDRPRDHVEEASPPVSRRAVDGRVLVAVAVAVAVGAFAVYAKCSKQEIPVGIEFVRAYGRVSFQNERYRLRAIALSKEGVGCVVGERATIACQRQDGESEWESIEPKDEADAQPDADTPNLNAVTFAGAGFAVGDEGAIVRFDLPAPPSNGGWERESSPTKASLRAVMPYDGGVLAVGDGGVTLVKRGESGWKVESPADVDLLMLLAEPPLAVGKGGAIFELARSNGTLRWGRQPSPTIKDPVAITRLGGDVWILDAAGTLLRGQVGAGAPSWSIARAGGAPSPAAMCPLGERGLLLTFREQEEALFLGRGLRGALTETPVPTFTNVKTMVCTERFVRRITTHGGDVVQTERVKWAVP